MSNNPHFFINPYNSEIVFAVYRVAGAYRDRNQEVYDQQIASIFNALDKACCFSTKVSCCLSLTIVARYLSFWSSFLLKKRPQKKQNLSNWIF